MAQHRADQLAERRVAGLGQLGRVPRRQRPVLAQLVERVRRRTDVQPAGEHSLQRPGVRAVRRRPRPRGRGSRRWSCPTRTLPPAPPRAARRRAAAASSASAPGSPTSRRLRRRRASAGPAAARASPGTTCRAPRRGRCRRRSPRGRASPGRTHRAGPPGRGWRAGRRAAPGPVPWRASWRRGRSGRRCCPPRMVAASASTCERSSAGADRYSGVSSGQTYCGARKRLLLGEYGDASSGGTGGPACRGLTRISAAPWPAAPRRQQPQVGEVADAPRVLRPQLVELGCPPPAAVDVGEPWRRDEERGTGLDAVSGDDQAVEAERQVTRQQHLEAGHRQVPYRGVLELDPSSRGRGEQRYGPGLALLGHHGRRHERLLGQGGREGCFGIGDVHAKSSQDRRDHVVVDGHRAGSPVVVTGGDTVVLGEGAQRADLGHDGTLPEAQQCDSFRHSPARRSRLRRRPSRSRPPAGRRRSWPGSDATAGPSGRC